MNKGYQLFLFGVCLLMLMDIDSKAQNWMPLSNGIERGVYSLYSDSVNLYAGEIAGGSSNKAVDYFDGVNWNLVGDGCCDGTITSIVKFQGNIYMCPTFKKWDGISWTVVDSTNPTVVGLYVFNNVLYVMGGFDSIGGIAADKIACFDGVNWQAIDTAKWFGGYIRHAIVYNGELYIGGNIISFDGTISNCAKWNGTRWTAVGNNGLAGGIQSVVSFEIYNGDLYIGGYFSQAMGNVSNYIARWNGSQWLDVGGGLNSTAYSMQAYNGELWVGGDFYNAGGLPVNQLAKWNGSNWCSVGFSSEGGWCWVMAMTLHNNELIIGGNFKTIDDDTVNYVAKWIGGNYVDTCGAATGVNEITEQTIFTIMPNPATNRLSCTITSAALIPAFGIRGQTTLQILSIEGKTLSAPQPVSQERTEVDISTLPAGLYFLVLSSPPTPLPRERGAPYRVVRKFVKE